MITPRRKYVDNVVRHVPEASRSDIAEEISAIISDMVDARLADTSDPDTAAEALAERQVLEELGDPVALSRQYSDHPQHLIGPDMFPTYLRALQWLLPIVAVIAVMVNGVVYSLTTPEVAIGGLIGGIAGNTITALLIWFAVVTIGLAIAERVMSATEIRRLPRSRRRTWTVDQLNEPVGQGGNSLRSEAIVGLVVLAMLATIPLLPTTFFYAGHLNDGETFINPALWHGWIPGYWALLAALAAVEVWKLVRARLSRAALVTGMAADLLMAVFLTVVLLSQDVLHPALLAAASAPAWMVWFPVAAIWLIFVWDQISTVRLHRADTTSR